MRLNEAQVAHEHVLSHERVQRDALWEHARIGLGRLECEIGKTAGFAAQLGHPLALNRGQIGHRGKNPLQLVDLVENGSQIRIRKRNARERVLAAGIVGHRGGGRLVVLF